jgi:hypothetical protein
MLCPVSVSHTSSVSTSRAMIVVSDKLQQLKSRLPETANAPISVRRSSAMDGHNLRIADPDSVSCHGTMSK